MKPTRTGLLAGWAALALGLLWSMLAYRAGRLECAFAYLSAFGFLASTLVGVLALLTMTYVVNARWFIVLSGSGLLLVSPTLYLPLLFVPIALALRLLYPWAGRPLLSAETLSASGQTAALGQVWMSSGPFLIRAAVYLLVWVGIAEALRYAALAQARKRSTWLLTHRSALSAVALPLLGLSTTWASFDWLLSAVPGWNMTSAGLYVLTGGFASALGVLAVLVHFQRRSGWLPTAVGPAHSLALGRLLFAAVCLWAYIAVSQLIIVWIADLPREAAFYVPRAHAAWRHVAALLVFGHFVVPFLLLLSRNWKQRSGFVAGLGAWLALMHAVDLYWLIQPSARAAPSLLDLGPFLLLGALASVLVRLRSRTAPRVPLHDPELARSLGYESP